MLQGYGVLLYNSYFCCCSEYGTVKVIARNEGGVEIPITSTSGSQAVFCGQHVSLVLTGLDQVHVAK